jgi:hypothetical protein
MILSSRGLDSDQLTAPSALLRNFSRLESSTCGGWAASFDLRCNMTCRIDLVKDELLLRVRVEIRQHILHLEALAAIRLLDLRDRDIADSTGGSSLCTDVAFTSPAPQFGNARYGLATLPVLASGNGPRRMVNTQSSADKLLLTIPRGR